MKDIQAKTKKFGGKLKTVLSKIGDMIYRHPVIVSSVILAICVAVLLYCLTILGTLKACWHIERVNESESPQIVEQIQSNEKKYAEIKESLIASVLEPRGIKTTVDNMIFFLDEEMNPDYAYAVIIYCYRPTENDYIKVSGVNYNIEDTFLRKALDNLYYS